MSYNGFPMEIATDPFDKKISIVIRTEMGRIYTLYMGQAMKLSLDGFVDVDSIEATENSLYIECKKIRSETKK